MKSNHGLTVVPKRPPEALGRDVPQQAAQGLQCIIRGSMFSKIYHRSGCEYGDKISHPRVFSSSGEAREQGYRACSLCHPP